MSATRRKKPGAAPGEPRDEWEVLATFHPGERGIRRLEKAWGAKLVCVRYRYNAARGRRRTTVEIVVGEAPWRRRRKGEVGVEIRSWESELRKAIVSAGGRWDGKRKLWLLARNEAGKLGLEGRIKNSPAPPTASPSDKR